MQKIYIEHVKKEDLNQFFEDSEYNLLKEHKKIWMKMIHFICSYKYLDNNEYIHKNLLFKKKILKLSKEAGSLKYDEFVLAWMHDSISSISSYNVKQKSI